jgi:hypothetical protein
MTPAHCETDHTTRAVPFVASDEMTVARLITLGMRSSLMMLLGAALLIVPVALGLNPVAIFTGLTAGAIAVALGIAGTAVGGRATLPVSAHAAYDRGLALGLLLAAIVLGAAGEGGGAAVLGVGGMASLAIAVTTRYSALAA